MALIDDRDREKVRGMLSGLTGSVKLEATEFPHLSQRYQVRGVPRTVVNETGFIDGGLPEAMFVEQMLAAVSRS